MTNTTLEYYQKQALKIAENYEKVDMSSLQRRLQKSFPKGGKLLELGCGSGRDATFLHSNGFDIYVSDASENMLNNAISIHPELKKNYYKLVLPDIFPFNDNFFDGVYAIAVLMHLKTEDIILTLQEIHRVLKPTSHFFFSVPLERTALDSQNKDDKGRLFNLLSETEWIHLCESTGFKLINTDKNSDSMGRDGILWCSFLFKRIN